MADKNNKTNEREYAKKLLVDKFNELGRLPVKLDFQQKETVTIKYAFGPWPRALENAGLKPVAETYVLRKKLRREHRRKRRQDRYSDE